MSSRRQELAAPPPPRRVAAGRGCAATSSRCPRGSPHPGPTRHPAPPSPAVSVRPAIAFIDAGNGAWLTFVIATVSLVLIGYSVSIFARRFASAGSFYVYNTKALGSAGGFASGWALVLGYIFTAMATTCGVAIYPCAFRGQAGLHCATTH